MIQVKRALLIVVLLCCCVGCDQVTKDLAQRHLAPQSPMSWFYDTVRLEYAENSGSFLSAGAELPKNIRTLVFLVVPGLFLLGLLLVLLTAPSASIGSLSGWLLILSGGAGNLLDRLFHDGRVIDFMNLGIGGLRTGIFNVADVCITFGVLLLLREYFEKAGRQELRRS